MRTGKSTPTVLAAMARGARAGAVASVLSAVVLAGTAGVAQASLSQVQDGFEVSPQGAWVRATGGQASAGFDINQGTARSGANNGWLFATNGWAFEGFWAPTNAAPWYAQCAAQIYVQSAGAAQVGIEVWDGQAHLLASNYPFVGGNGYQPVSTRRWALNGVNPVFVKVIIGNSSGAKFVRADDMTLQCYW
ncbi:hypothetical protein [Couchioplanes azureus]|uniref:hypothetical protein n=1 Tax=Couchioplanes caeruleus TaxID=56438 RepID=UPI001995DCE3|nr:hypothetical protein [Couchioplanes caeruleus]GGQ72966.1 hypothetical protein GCM10010166_48700 [Couchioplanes caeruleus subsp. azureus]